jgi:hypothetical protein
LKDVFGIQEVSVQQQSGDVTFTYDERSASFWDFIEETVSNGISMSILHVPPEIEVHSYVYT